MMYGWPLSADGFDDLSVAIANGRMQVISYDRRGFSSRYAFSCARGGKASVRSS